MFGNVGWGEMLVLVVAGLVILGPERLPGAIRWTTGTLRQVREYLSGATSQLREDLGPEFEDLRQPLSELQKLGDEHFILLGSREYELFFRKFMEEEYLREGLDT